MVTEISVASLVVKATDASTTAAVVSLIVTLPLLLSAVS